MTQQSKHTEGPWRWHGQVYSQQEAANILTESQRREGQQDRSVTFVTMDGYYDAMARGLDWEQAAANARLIAAAPDLLDALKAVKKSLDELNGGDGPDSGSNLEADLFQINASITKAEGR